jgi:hypothetical protein
MSRSLTDLSPQLQARLADVERRRDAEAERHLAAERDLDREEAIIKAMIDLEKGRSLTGSDVAAMMAGPLRPGAVNTMESEILGFLSNKEDWGHADIKAFLIERGLGTSSDAQFGRSIHGTLLSMRGRDLVESLGTGKWRIVKKGSANAA